MDLDTGKIQFYTRMSDVKTMRRLKRAPELNINKYLAPKKEILEAVYKVIRPHIHQGATDYERGLEDM